MANIPVLSGAGATVYIKAAGAGSDADPFIPNHSLAAGVENVGDVDVLSLVGDNADLDSGAGADNHAVVAWGLPANGGHVIGGTPANPIRFDPVASTVMPISVASWFVGAQVVATVVGNPAVIASIAGVPSVLASIPNVPGVAIVSSYINANTLVSIPNVAQISIASFYPSANVVASVIGNPAVIASIAGAPNVLASIPNVPNVAIASMNVPGGLYTFSQFQVVGRIQASVNNGLPIAAAGANVRNYITSITVVNASASYGGAVHVQDGTSTIHVGYAANAGGGYAPSFPSALKPAANATVFIGVPTYSLDLYITVAGYQGA